MPDLRGRKAVVTGGAMGIGLETCKRLLGEGCNITIWDMNEEAMAEAREVLEPLGGKVFTHSCDVTDKVCVRVPWPPRPRRIWARWIS